MSYHYIPKISMDNKVSKESVLDLYQKQQFAKIGLSIWNCEINVFEMHFSCDNFQIINFLF